MRVAALGGGHGLAASLSALRRVEHSEITGIVTVADNGGSSGRLREEFGGLPPGDLRMALAALCGDDDWGRTWAEVLQHRFSSPGPLDNHAVGNLLITAIWDLLDDHVKGLDLVGQLLGARGRVLPMAAVPLDIEARVRPTAAPDEVRIVRGQVQVATIDGQVETVRLHPPDPPAVPEAVAAIRDAQWVVIGPGSWFTSVMPTLLVPELREALLTTTARRVLVLNLRGSDHETRDLSPVAHLDVLASHAPDLRLDAVVADETLIDASGALQRAAASLGADLHVAAVAGDPQRDQHDAARLAAAFDHVMRQA